ncbi:MAG: VOC family protein, partial [Candidatus Eremiobacteraeota bacterium]|nr:VOC family protein [Candidatus Eremiobacteraeota bacterium]
VKFYTSIFNNSKIHGFTYYGESGPGPAGSVMTAKFELNGQEFVALNGGPEYKFTPAVSFVISCDTQEEIDHFWNALTEGGQEVACGWLTDKYGVSWQVVPTIIGDLFSDEDEEKSQRAMQAMLQMKKLDIQALQDAFDGKAPATT